MSDSSVSSKVSPGQVVRSCGELNWTPSFENLPLQIMAAGGDVGALVFQIESMQRGPYLLLRCLPFGGECRPSMALNEALWRNIPEELLHKLLALLPPKSIARFRAVCRAWRALLSSKAFLGRRAIRPIYGVELIDRKQAMASSVATPGSSHPRFGPGEWVRKVDLSFLREKFRNVDGTVYAAADGLVCVYDNRITTRASFCVFNPWTKEYKELPRCKDIDLVWERVFLAVEKASPLRFKLLVCTLVGYGGPGHLYSSETDEWTTLWRKGAHREPCTQYPYWPQFLLSSSRMVAVYRDIRESLYDYDLEAYDADLVGQAYAVDVVKANYEDRNDRNMRYPVKMLEYNGEIHMITGSDAIYFNTTRRWRPDEVQLSVWKLNSDSLWSRVSSIPPDLANSLTIQGNQWEHFPGDAAVVGDTIYVSITVRKPDPDNSRRFVVLCSHVVLYHILSDEWEVWEKDLGPGLLGRTFRLFTRPV